MRVHLQEGLCAGGGPDGSAQQNDDNVHHRIGRSLRQLFYNAALTEQVAEHQHSNQRSRGRKKQTHNHRDDNREENLLQLRDRAKLLPS